MSVKTIRMLPKVAGAYPFAGHAFSLSPNKIHQQLEDWSHQYGGFYRIKIFGKHCLVIADADLLREVLQQRITPYNRPKGFVNALKSLKIDSLFTNDEQAWYLQRRLVVDSMNISKLRGVFSVFSDVTSTFANLWRSKINTVVDLNTDARRYAFDMLCNVSLNYQINSFGTSDDSLFEAVDLIFEALNKRAQQPIPFYRFYKSPFDKKVDKATLLMTDYIRKVIQHERNSGDHDNTCNIVQSMLRENASSTSQLNEEQLIGNLLLLICAGLHTVGNTITWLVYHLARHPECQHRLRNEINGYLNTHGEPTEFRDFETLPFLQAFIKESMRLKPSAPLIFMQADRDVILKGIQIPKGTDIFGLTGAAGRSSRAFDNPLVFNPERWLEKNDQSTNVDRPCHNQKAYMPFSSGPTFCPGRNLAMFECQILLFTICRNFHVAIDASTEPVEEIYHIGLEASPINITITKA